MKKNFKSILKIFFFTIFFGFFWVENVFAEIFTLAGKNDTINFNSDTTIQLNTVNKTISGKFYSEILGESISINEQKLTCRDNTCNANLIFYSEMIGKINLNININTTTRIMSGNINSDTMGLIGNLSGIHANNSEIHLDLQNITADDNARIEINNAKPSHNYELKIITPESTSFLFTSINGIFSGIDFSLAGKYSFELKDLTENKTWTYTDIVVKAGEISNFIKVGDFYAKTFCKNNSSNISLCPDGSNRKATEMKLEANPNTIVFFSLRDNYGNKIDQENLTLEISHNLKENELDPNSNKLSLIPLVLNNQVTNYGNKVTLQKNRYYFTLNTAIPTNDYNQIFLQKISYGNKDISTIFSNRNIHIPQPLTVNIEGPNILYTENNTPVVVKTSGNSTGNPQVIARINDDINTNITDCTNCGSTSIGKKLFRLPGGGGAVSLLPSLISNDTKLEIFIRHTIGGKMYTYKAAEKNFSIREPKSENLAIESGISNIQINDDTPSTIQNKYLRSRLLNLIEKNIAYIKRNNHNSTHSTYLIKDTDIIITDNMRDHIRSYISLGGDIIIDDNINFDTNTPIALIAISRNGQGGNIKISGDVTNINASLVAENNILGNDANKKNQLAIIGSVMANNFCSDISTSDCFENLRQDFDFKNLDGYSKKSSGFLSNMNKIIIQYNPAIKTNPPPGLENFTE